MTCQRISILTLVAFYCDVPWIKNQVPYHHIQLFSYIRVVDEFELKDPFRRAAVLHQQSLLLRFWTGKTVLTGILTYFQFVIKSIKCCRFVRIAQYNVENAMHAIEPSP